MGARILPLVTGFLIAVLSSAVMAQVDLFSTDPDDFSAQMYQMELDHRIWMLEQPSPEPCCRGYDTSPLNDGDWNSMRVILYQQGFNTEQVERMIGEMKKM